MRKPDNCAACGKPTTSHNVAVDVSEHDEIGLPTMAGVVCHTCWVGDTDGVPPINHTLDAARTGDDESRDLLNSALSFADMVSVAATVEELNNGAR